MGSAGKPEVDISTDPEPGPETSLLHNPEGGGSSSTTTKVPSDSFHLVYIIYFTLGVGFLLPWNAFITAVDYFSYLYPSTAVDRIFAVVYFLVGLICLLIIIVFYAHKSLASFRINLGLLLFVIALLVVPLLDLFYLKGQVGLYAGFDITSASVGLSGLADALMQGGLIGVAGEMDARYTQAIIAGTAGSGVLVSLLRILTKAVYPQDPDGLRKSANLYFAVGIVVMVICAVSYNVAHRLPVIKFYEARNAQRRVKDSRENGSLTGPMWRKTLWKIVKEIKAHGFGIILVYIVTLSIFPGYITEDVHSELLKDWFPVLLIAAFNVFDLVGKSLTAVFMFEDVRIAVAGCIARLLFYPLFWGCLHGPMFLRTEIPVAILTSLLGLTNGYLTSVLMILTPTAVKQKRHAETAGIVSVLFLVIGLASGSVLAWFWVI